MTENDRCGKCDACQIEEIGCACDGAFDNGCFLCTPDKHKRPLCPAPRQVWLLEWTNDGEKWRFHHNVIVYTTEEEATAAVEQIMKSTEQDIHVRATPFISKERYDNRKSEEWQRALSLGGDLFKLKRDLDDLMERHQFDLTPHPTLTPEALDQAAAIRLMVWSAVDNYRNVSIDCDPSTKVWRVLCTTFQRPGGAPLCQEGVSRSFADAVAKALAE